MEEVSNIKCKICDITIIEDNKCECHFIPKFIINGLNETLSIIAGDGKKIQTCDRQTKKFFSKGFKNLAQDELIGLNFKKIREMKNQHLFI